MKAKARFVALFNRGGADRNRHRPFVPRGAFLHAGGSGAPSTTRRSPKLAFLAAAALVLTLVLGVSLAAATAPTVTIENASEVKYTTAQVEGTVDPQGQSTTYRFQYVTEAQFQENLANSLPGFEGAATGIEETAETSGSVSGQLSGLAPNTTYHLRLFAENGDGPSEVEAAATFTTLEVQAPKVSANDATEVAYTTAKASGEVEVANEDPAFNASCRFEYVTDFQFTEEGEFAAAEPNGQLAPCSPETVEGTSPQPVSVGANLTSLHPGTVYHLRLVATNLGGSGTDVAPDTFKTEAVAKPSVTIEAPSAITSSSAHFAGFVNPNAPKPEAETSAAEQQAFESSWRFECNPGCGSPSGPNVQADDNPHGVEVEATGLQFNTTYEVTLHASNAGGEEVSETKSFKTDAIPPGVALGTNTPIGDTEVHLRGYVNRHNSEVTECHFDYGLTTGYGKSSPCVGIDEVQTITVSAASGQFKLSFGGQTTKDIPFNALASTAQAALQSLSSIGAGNVSVKGGPGDPTGSTPYKVTFLGLLAEQDVEQITAEDGTTPLGGGSGASVATTTPGATPSGRLNALPSDEPHETSANLKGLEPGATYHFRLVTNTADGGTANSEDGIFEVLNAYEAPEGCPNEDRRTEQHSTFLPDCRAYEMVSPPDKNGADVMISPGRTRVAADGSAASFISLGGFGDAAAAGLVASDYESVRGPGGWSTHAITPPQAAITFTELLLTYQPLYEGPFSPDLSKGVFVSASPLSSDPNVAGASNLYLRDDLRSAGSGNYQLLSPCPRCEEPGGEPLPQPGSGSSFPRSGMGKPSFAAASTDFGHVVFEGQQRLTADAPGTCDPEEFQNQETCPSKLYESDHGTVRLVGLVPPAGHSECGPSPLLACEPSQEAEAGQGSSPSHGGSASYLMPHVVSADGSRVFFTVPASGCSLGETCGALYLREDHSTTAQLNVSERQGQLEPDEPSSGPAKYWGASADGSRVFFTAAAALTDDPAGGEQHLYMYNVDAPAGHHLTLISADHEPTDESEAVNVLGTSADGHYVYFAARGQLVAGQPLANKGLYVWHDGIIRYIAPLGGFRDENEDTAVKNWFFGSPSARVTPDGQYLLFSSTEQGTEGPLGSDYDQGSCHSGPGLGCRELYLYSNASQRLTCASCNSAGPTAGAITFKEVGNQGVLKSSAESQLLSSDGRRVFFSTAEALVGEDTNGKSDAYEYDVETGTVHLVSSGTDEADSYFMGASEDGSGIFFVTHQTLLGADTDQNYDLYVAREGGGFAEPPPAPATCEGETCKGIPAPQPGSATPGSATNIGPGNPRPHRHHRKHRRKHHKRAAKHNRRTSR